MILSQLSNKDDSNKDDSESNLINYDHRVLRHLLLPKIHLRQPIIIRISLIGAYILHFDVI